MPTVLPPLPTAAEQADRLIALGVHELAGLPRTTSVQRPAAWGAGCPARGAPGAGDRLGLAPLLGSSNGKPGFVVADMTDVDLFTPIDEAQLPDGPVYWSTTSTEATRWRTGAPTRRCRQSPRPAGRR